MRNVLVAVLFIVFAGASACADERALNQDMDTIKVDVPWARTRPSPSVTSASPSPSVFPNLILRPLAMSLPFLADAR